MADGQEEKDKIENKSLRVFDLSNPAAPSQVSRTEITDFPMTVPTLVVVDNDLLMTFNGQYTWDYDISNPTQPTLKGQLPNVSLGGPNENMIYCEPYLIRCGSMLYDISDISNPQLAAMPSVSGSWTGTIVDDLYYLATNDEGIYIFRLNDK